MKQSIAKTQKRSRSSWSPRSGEKSALAQAGDSRLGKTATVAPREFRELSLRRGCLARRSKHSPSPRRALEQKNWASSCYSRLGDMGSPG